jgi:hypothetical protein
VRDALWTVLPEYARHQLAVADIALDQDVVGVIEVHADVVPLAGRAVVVAEVIQADDTLAARQERIGQVAADESRAAGD